MTIYCEASEKQTGYSDAFAGTDGVTLGDTVSVSYGLPLLQCRHRDGKTKSSSL
jgi:hypothetical protein